MKKIYTTLILISFAFFGFSQNMVVNGDMENWDNATTPAGWDIYDNINQNSVTVHGGTYSAAQTSDESTQKLRQDVFSIVGGTQYTISYYFLDNVADARTRIWSYWMDNGTYLDDNEDELRPGEYSIESAEWQHYTVTLTAPLNANEFRFDVRTYKQDGSYGGVIYFDDFSITGETTIYPEPSNYPTSFTATASGLSIEVMWDESVGTQLPTGYVIYGKMSEFPPTTVPVDGVSVPDDLDWSDGSAAVNVAYGSGGYTFSSLNPSTLYTFSVYPFTNTGVNIDYKTDGNAPIAGATTANVSQLLSEPFDNDLGVFSHFNVTGPQEWEWADYGDPPGCAKGNGYSGGAVENEDWLISPKLNATNFESLDLSFQHARNYASNDGLEVAISTDYSGSGDPNLATWDYITSSFTFPEQGSWDFIDAGTADISAYITGSTYIAFVYNSTSSDASTWEIDNVEVLGVMSTDINEITDQITNIYPNPASDFITVESNIESEFIIVSMDGKVMLTGKLENGQNQINVFDLPAGMYFMQAADNSGNISAKKFTIK